MLDSTTNQPPKFKTKKHAEVNDETCQIYSKNIKTKFQTIIVNSSSIDYSNSSILSKRTITLLGKQNQIKKIKKWCSQIVYYLLVLKTEHTKHK